MSNKICLRVNIDSLTIDEKIYGEIIDKKDDEDVPNNIFGVYQLFYAYCASLIFIKNRHLIDNYKSSDTLFWSNCTHDLISIVTTLPDIEHSSETAGMIAGENYVRHLASVWKTEERMLYFSINRLMRKAYKKFILNDLSGAQKIWKKVYEIATRKLASEAAFNVALIYELFDDLNASEDWLHKSDEMCQKQLTLEYFNKIKKRQKMQLELDKQLLN